MQLWRAYPRFDGRVKISTWMHRIAVNVAILARTRTLHGVADAIAGRSLTAALDSLNAIQRFERDP